MTVPSLQFDANYIMERVVALQREDWVHRVMGMRTGTWSGDGLPYGITIKDFRKQWGTFNLLEDLERVTSPAFSLSSPVHGADAIRQTVLTDSSSWLMLIISSWQT
jgi:hypothetical protein